MNNDNKELSIKDGIIKEAKEVLNYAWEISRKTRKKKNIIFHTLILLIMAIYILVDTYRKNTTTDKYNKFVIYMKKILKKLLPMFEFK